MSERLYILTDARAFFLDADRDQIAIGYAALIGANHEDVLAKVDEGFDEDGERIGGDVAICLGNRWIWLKADEILELAVFMGMNC